jgi:hypothetical protein
LMSCSYDPPLVEFEFWYGWPGITQVHIQVSHRCTYRYHTGAHTGITQVHIQVSHRCTYRYHTGAHTGITQVHIQVSHRCTYRYHTGAHTGITQVHIQVSHRCTYRYHTGAHTGITQVHIQVVGHPYFLDTLKLFLQEQIKGIIITTHTTHRYRCSHTTNTSLCTKCHLQHILSPTYHAQSVTHNTLTTNLPMLTHNTNNTYANGVSYCKKKLYEKNSINSRILFSKSKGGVGWKTRRSVWEEAPEHEA